MEIEPGGASSWEQRLIKVTQRLSLADAAFGRQLKYFVMDIHRQIVRMDFSNANDRKVFPAPQDLSSGRLPPMDIGCVIYGAAIYADREDKVHISKPIWRSLPDAHKAALVLHEALYRYQRELYRTAKLSVKLDSAAVRRLVGYAFSSSMPLTGTGVNGLIVGMRSNEIYTSKDWSELPDLLRPMQWSALKGLDRDVYLPKSCKTLYVEVHDNDDQRIDCRLNLIKTFGSGEYTEIKTEDLTSKRIQVASGIRTFAVPNSPELKGDLVLTCATPKSAGHPGFRLKCDSLEKLPEAWVDSRRQAFTGMTLQQKSDYGDFGEAIELKAW